MLRNLNLQKVLFLDIETVSGQPNFAALDETWQYLWADKTKFAREREEVSAAEFYPQRAGIMAEFGKVVCISCGFFSRYGTTGREFRIKSFYGDDERILLSEFAEMLDRHFDGPEFMLCAHNGKEFDFPYLSRRLLINGMPLPFALDTAGKKPWEIAHLDTMELWKFGDFKHYTSLKLLAALFNIPTPKDDIDGSQVGPLYWAEKDLPRIATYCQKDTLTVAQILLRYRGENILKDHEVVLPA
jgi:DNA polymerase elongation subunit (family B)